MVLEVAFGCVTVHKGREVFGPYMKRLFRGFYMSLGMFCAIPLPYRKWHENCANLVIPFFPAVGSIIGALWYGAARLLLSAGLGKVMLLQL